MKPVSGVNKQIHQFFIQHSGMGGKTYPELAKQFHTSAEVVRGVFRRWKADPTMTRKQQKLSVPGDKDQDVDSLVASFDLAAKIRQALREMPYRKYREDDVFRRMFVVGNERWRAVTGRPEFGEYKVELPNHRFVWCSDKTAKYLRSRLLDVM